MIDEVLQFVLDYIQREIPIPENMEIDSFDYLDEGYLDSIENFSFIIELEEKFNISISEEEMLDEKYHTIKGLCDLIRRKMEDK